MNNGRDSPAFLLNDYSLWFARMGFSHPFSSPHLPPSILPSILFVHSFQRIIMYGNHTTVYSHSAVSFLTLSLCSTGPFAQSFIKFNLSDPSHFLYIHPSRWTDPQRAFRLCPEIATVKKNKS